MNQLPARWNLFRHLAKLRVIFCLALCGFVCADAGEIKLVNVSNNLPLDRVILRTYAVSTDETPPVQLSFEASKFAPPGRRPWWWLNVMCSDNAPLSTDQPLSMNHDILYGKNGLVYRWLDQFLADVPDAEVTGFVILLQINDKMWPELRKYLVPVYKRQDGVATRPARGAQSALYKYINQSPEVAAIARKISSRLHRRVTSITLGVEHVGFDNKYRNKPWSELIDSPTLGLEMKTIPVDISFESSDPADKR